MKQEAFVSSNDHFGRCEDVDVTNIVRILEKHTEDRGGLIAILEEIRGLVAKLLEEEEGKRKKGKHR